MAPSRPLEFPQDTAQTLSEDGNALQFCTTCAFSRACLDQGMDKRALMDLHVLVEHVGPIAPGESVFHAGDRFDAIYAVRAGTVKTATVDREGRPHVLGFHLPGEVIGLDAIDVDRYPCDAIALDTVMLCRFSFPKIAALATRLPGLQTQLFRLMSRDIGRATLMAGEWPAEQRVAAFFVDLSARLAARGFSPDRFRLTMPRADIASYLHLTPETVSRVLHRLQEEDVVRADRRDIVLNDRARLAALAEPILRR